MTSFIPVENVQFNKRLTGIEQDTNGVTLQFSDGTTAAASILVGADGIQSIARSHVLADQPTQIAPVYAEAYCYRGVIPMSEAYEILGDLTDVAKFYFGHGQGAVTYRISGGEVSGGGIKKKKLIIVSQSLTMRAAGVQFSSLCC